MKIILTFLSFFYVLGISAQTLPNITVTDTKGTEHNLYETLDSGKVVLLDFFFVDCSACNYWNPEIEKLIEDYEGTNLEIWSISPYDSDTRLDGSKFKSKHEHHIVAGYKGNGRVATDIFAGKYNLVGFPSFSVICSDKSISWDIYPLSLGVPEIKSKLDNTCGVSQVTAVDENDVISQLTIYPNPSSESITINVSDLGKKASLSVTNMQGQTVSQRILRGYQDKISITLPESGLYLVKMNTEKKTITQKVIRL